MIPATERGFFMRDTIDNVHKQLAKVAGLHARVQASDDRIGQSAGDRLAKVDQMLAELRPNVILDSDAADEYMALVQERGQLVTTQQATRQKTGSQS
jgi:hypothetical protein